MKFPRFRVRTLSILVLISGIGFGGYALLYTRSTECRRLADYYAQLEARETVSEQACIALNARNERLLKQGKIPEDDPVIQGAKNERRLRAERKDGYRSARLRFDRVARYPWLPLSADPLPPE